MSAVLNHFGLSSTIFQLGDLLNGSANKKKGRGQTPVSALVKVLTNKGQPQGAAPTNMNLLLMQLPITHISTDQSEP